MRAKIDNGFIFAPIAKPNPEKIITFESGALYAIGSTSGPGAAEIDKALKLAQAKDFNKAIDTLKEVRLNFPGTANALAAAYNIASLYQYLGLTDNLRVLSTGVLRESVAEPYRYAAIPGWLPAHGVAFEG